MIRHDNFIYDLIEKRKKEDLSSKFDFLSEVVKQQGVGENKFDNKFIRDTVVNFFIAGRDTTATLLTWAFYFLSKYPDVEKKVANEVESVLQGDVPTYENCKQMKYLQTVLDETLRLYPPAILHNIKSALKDDVLPSGKKVAPGTFVGWCIYYTHRMPEYWGADANEFNPDRWEKPLKHPCQFLPFALMPRLCMGMDMAYTEAKSIIALFIQHGFRLKLVPGQTFDFKPYFTTILTAKDGMKMHVEKCS